jgi:porin
VFNGDPGGRGLQEVEVRNRTGTRFPLTDPPLAIQEVQYRYNQGERDDGLAGILRVGSWQHLGRFDDRRFGDDGLLLADPVGNGARRRLQGNWGVYGVVDQQIYRPPGGDALSGVTAFSRISLSPSDRNLVRFYLDGGLVFKGLTPGRPNDMAGATFLWSEISGSVRGLDIDQIVSSGIPGPVRSREITLELSYVAEIVPGWSIQPDLQYVIRPGGGAPNPRDPTGRAIPNATVLGLRTTIVY